jgi:ferredoxin-NADP reductase/hemoglobin-like flavoprotein
VPISGENPARPGGVTSYDAWLTWKHRAQFRERALRAATPDENRVNVTALDWGDQATLESSVALIGPVARNVVALFYRELFTRLPGLRQLFPADLSVQKDRLLAALLALVAGGTEPHRLVRVLEELGRDHRKFGVRDAQYRAVGAALLTALAHYCGPAWTPALKRAWRARYEAAATVMIHAAADARDQPPYWYATVTAHEPCGRDVAILRVRPHAPYPYVAGQYASLESARLPRVWRPYSMATPPRADQQLEFHVRAIGHGGLSDTLVASAPGDLVRIGPPQGTVTMRPDAARPLLFVAGGTGWSTVKALLTECVRESRLNSASRLLVSCRLGEPYDPAFTRFVHELPDISTTLVHSAAELRAELAPTRLVRPDLDACLSGPPGLVETASRLLNTAGVPHTRIHHDDLLPA